MESPPEAVLEQLLREAPFVRALARRLVAAEADDVVQATYARALAGRPGPLRSPRAFLLRIARNVASNLRRARRRRRDDGEVVAEPAGPESAPASRSAAATRSCSTAGSRRRARARCASRPCTPAATTVRVQVR